MTTSSGTSRPNLPPHRFTVRGEEWRMRYGDAKKLRGGKNFDRSKDWGMVEMENKLMYLDPVLRLKKNHDKLWTWFTHELLHVIFPKMPHVEIYKLQRRVGRWLQENFKTGGLA